MPIAIDTNPIPTIGQPQRTINTLPASAAIPKHATIAHHT
jgi:hypothetical protein